VSRPRKLSGVYDRETVTEPIYNAGGGAVQVAANCADWNGAKLVLQCCDRDGRWRTLDALDCDGMIVGQMNSGLVRLTIAGAAPAKPIFVLALAEEGRAL
jgi:hypothetical protein